MTTCQLHMNGAVFRRARHRRESRVTEYGALNVAACAFGAALAHHDGHAFPVQKQLVRGPSRKPLGLRRELAPVRFECELPTERLWLGRRSEQSGAENKEQR